MSKKPSLSIKVHRVLRIIFFLLLIIALRVWHLSFVEREERIVDAQKPQKRSVQIHANRGIIVDRYGEPLACNKLRYDAAIYYAHIRQLPQVKWETDANGKKAKRFPRKEHITALSNMLSKELKNLDPARIEDLIHSKASIMPHAPFIIKENITEEQFCRLRLMEKDWVGLHAQMGSERFYPQKMVGSHILGYMGAISQKEYLKVAKEIKELQEIIDEEENLLDPIIPPPYQTIDDVRSKLDELKALTYSINDLVGKSGLEGICDRDLRGFHGKEVFSVDINGRFLKKLPEGSRSNGGKTIKTTISLDLQKFAEELLIEDEKIREGKSRTYDAKTKKTIEKKQPWIKGGAIIAMDPKSGEILALATHPRFDPNDFISSSNPHINTPKQNRILQWFETPSHIAQIWNGLAPLSRERITPSSGQIFFEEQELSLPYFLSTLIPAESSLMSSIEKIKTLETAIKIQETTEELLYLSKEKDASLVFDVLYPKEDQNSLAKPYGDEEKKQEIYETLKTSSSNVFDLQKTLSPYFTNITDNRDKLLIVDLARVFVNSAFFSDELIGKTKFLSLVEYWDLSRKVLQLENRLQKKIREIFHETLFAKWREENQKEFLQNKREEEKRKKTYQRPYIDYLDKEEKRQFAKFWKENRLVLLTYFFSSSEEKDLPPFLKLFEEAFFTDHPLSLETKQISFLSGLEDALLYEFLRTIRPYQQLDRPLLGHYVFLRHPYSQQKEQDLAAAFYPKNGFHFASSYGYQQSTPLGSIFKIVTGYSALKQKYWDNKEKHLSLYDLNPLSIQDVVRWDRKAKKGGSIVYAYNSDGTPYPKYYKGGRLLRSSHPNIGDISFAEAMERSSNPYFSILAGDFLQDPEDLCKTASEMGFGKRSGIDLPGEIRGNLAYDLADNKTGLYSFAIGHHTLVVTPLQAAVMLSSIVNGGDILKPQILSEKEKEVKNSLFLPEPIREKLIEGLHLVVNGKKGSARGSVIKRLYQYPHLKETYKKVVNQLVGKTSTAEFMHQPNINSSSKAQKYNDIWFGAVSFDDDPMKSSSNPELVVVVYLKFGDGGKEAAPLAAQVIDKYRSIKQKKLHDHENRVEDPLE